MFWKALFNVVLYVCLMSNFTKFYTDSMERRERTMDTLLALLTIKDIQDKLDMSKKSI